MMYSVETRPGVYVKGAGVCGAVVRVVSATLPSFLGLCQGGGFGCRSGYHGWLVSHAQMGADADESHRPSPTSVDVDFSTMLRCRRIGRRMIWVLMHVVVATLLRGVVA